MNWKCLASLLAAVQLISLVYGAGTTVWVSVSHCPATTSLATGHRAPSGTPMPVPLYFLSVSPVSSLAPAMERRDTRSSYISSNGSTTGDCNNAATYAITQSGQLMGGGQLISTTGLVPNALFALSSSIAAISTTFSASNGVLQWNNPIFIGNQALFCHTGSTVEAVFNGQLPSGCTKVTLSLLLVSLTSCPSYGTSTSTTVSLLSSASTGTTSIKIPTISSSPSTSATAASSYPGSLSGNGVAADLIGGYVYASPATILSSVNENIISLEQCLTFCMGYMYFGVSEGILCTCGNAIAVGSRQATHGSCNIPCAGNAGELCGGSACIVVFRYRGMGSSPTSISITTLIVGSAPSPADTSTLATSSPTATISYPTSTGIPNCLDRSPFTGTVNGGYLILCDTALPGYDLAQVDGASLGDCITACTNYLAPSSPQQEPCVAVEYDQEASSNACHLKYTVGAVSSGGNATAQAAILVNQPNAPPIIYSTMSSATSSTTAISSIGPTSMATTAVTSTTPVPVPTTSIMSVVPPSSSPMMVSVSTVASSAMQLPPGGSMSPTASLIILSVSSMANAPPPPTSSSTSSAAGVLPTSPTTSYFPPSSNPAWPSASATGLCPGLNHQIVSQGLVSYEVECSEQLLGNVLTGNTTTASSLQQCFGFCNLLNLAQPFGCVGVNYLKTLSNANCLLLSTVFGYLSNPVQDSGRLIYAGYPSVTDAPLAISSTTTASSSLANLSTLPSISVGETSSSNRPNSLIGGQTIITSPGPVTVSSTVISSSIIRSATISSTISLSSVSTSTIGQSSTVLSSSINLLSSTTSATSPLSSDTRSGTCGATASTSIAPIPTGALCPGTPDGAVYGVSFSGTGTGSGTPYEIECSTNFAGVLDQPVVAVSLQDCINTCQQYKYSRQLPCYAVSFNNSAAALTLPPQNNCNLYASVTSVTHGVSQFDSARIVSNSSGYISVNDYCSTGGAAASSTAIGPIGGQSASVPGIGPASSNAGNVPATMTTTTGNTVSTSTAVALLCPGSNMTVVQDGNYKYEIECGLYYGGHDIGRPAGYTDTPTNIDGCVLQCNYWNDNPSLGHTCIYALYAGPPLNGCYNKDSVTGTRAQMAGYNIARLINSAYPSPTDLG